MNYLSRVGLLIKRAFKARRFGARFRGTTNFRMPTEVRHGKTIFQISSPEDEALKYDFINIWLDDEYRLSVVPTPRTVVDIGGNIGLFSLWAYMNYSDIELAVYEPNLELHPFLKRNLSMFKNSAVHSEAVGASTGWIQLSLADSSRLSRAISSNAASGANIPLVPISTVIERLGGSVDLLKMDCEGAEWEILSDTTSLRKVRYVVMEYHLFDGRTFHDLETLVGNASFDISYHNEKNSIVHLVNRNQ